ncbi:hypothetical protein ACIREO_08940 [Streptomyces sp. NPDC102441]|uniref:hypothetical protein n=1 Tax=Streptomyces sp. NPDC102441 TaxID=3366176 RepID=UPI00380A07AD
MTKRPAVGRRSSHVRTRPPDGCRISFPLPGPRQVSGIGTFHFAPGAPPTVGQDDAVSEERDARTGIAYPAPAQINMTPVSAADQSDVTHATSDPGWSVSSWRQAGSPGRARFESLYRDREWRRRSVALEFTFAGLMSQVPAFTEAARDGVFRMYQGLAARHGEVAAQRAFFPPDAVPADGAGLHNWVAERATRIAGFQRFDPYGHLNPPHRQLYGERMTYSEDITPSRLDLPGGLMRLTGAALAGNLPSGTRRERALHAWLRKYGDAGMRALARLAPAHLTAIHLYGGPDYEPMKTFLNGERLGAGMDRRLLRFSVWALIRDAVKLDAPAFVPTTLRGHPDLEELFDDMRAEGDLETPSAEVEELRGCLDVISDRQGSGIILAHRQAASADSTSRRRECERPAG